MATRTDFSEDQFEHLLNLGIAALKGNDTAQAQRWLGKAIRLRPGDSRPWFWLSQTTEKHDEKRTFLERAVAADPANAAARRGLAFLSGKLDTSRLLKEGEEPPHLQVNLPLPARSQNYTCPACGGRLAFYAANISMSCDYCGYSQTMKPRQVAEDDEQPVDFVIPTTRAHRWAESQQQLSCLSCGSLTLLPPGQRTDQCPYCGSNRMVVSAEQVELIEPQAILLMAIDRQQAAHRLNEWLSSGLLVPDHLQRETSKVNLRPAYYPFWTFNGVLELPWRCEVNDGSNRATQWVPRSGTEFQFFDDILVSGLQAINNQEIEALQPFDLEALVEFSPSYLAGWAAVNYVQPLADASLEARQKVVRQLRTRLYSMIEPGRDKRNIDTGAGKWSSMTFKHVLLPLWVGSYEYKHKTYPVIINGQSGKITGSKPRDYVKLSLYLILAVIGLAAALFMLFWLAKQG